MEIDFGVILLLVCIAAPIITAVIGIRENFTPISWKSEEFVPYDSYEFAGVRGSERQRLHRSREKLLRALTPPNSVTTAKRWHLIVLTDNICEKYTRNLPALPFSEMQTAIVHLRTGQKFLCSVDNGIYLTDVEGFWDGIPFGLEDIESFKGTKHWVTLKTMQHRSAVLAENSLLERMVHGQLTPGNY